MLKKKYGITIEQYNRMLIEQNNSCAICGKDADKCHNGLYVDHNHATGKIRKLLCRDCNVGIGHLMEDVLILRKAIEYLETINA